MQEVFDRLKSIGRKRQYNAGEMVFFEGEEAKNLFILLEGQVRLYKSQAEIGSKERELHKITSPNFIAEMPFFMELCYPANAEALCECEIVSIDMNLFKTQCLSDNAFCLSFIGSLCEKVHILESHIARANKHLQYRLIEFLLQKESTLANFTQRNIAQILNTAPESLSRIIKNLKKSQLIDTQKGKIIIKNKQKLQNLL